MIAWQYFPKSHPIPEHLRAIVREFGEHDAEIDSLAHELSSNEVLAIMQPGFTRQGYLVEANKSAAGRIHVPVLFGRNGRVEKAFDADAYHVGYETVIEIEAGRAVTNHQFLKDLFEACMMHDVRYLVVAVRNTYRGNPDFDRVLTFFDTLYTSGRLTLPLSGILIVGY